MSVAQRREEAWQSRKGKWEFKKASEGSPRNNYQIKNTLFRGKDVFPIQK